MSYVGENVRPGKRPGDGVNVCLPVSSRIGCQLVDHKLGHEILCLKTTPSYTLYLGLDAIRVSHT
jgi:hypothetical protein